MRDREEKMKNNMRFIQKTYRGLSLGLAGD